jgi:filamentous hemagglutinin
MPFKWHFPGEHDAELATKTAIFWYSIFAGGAVTVSAIEGGAAGGLQTAIKKLREKYKQWQREKENRELLDQGNKADKNKMTRAGRALQKHSSREGTVYEKPTSTKPADYNKAGQAELKKILESEGRQVKPNKYGGKDYTDPSSGKGARFDKDGSFKGFLEPNKLKT